MQAITPLRFSYGVELLLELTPHCHRKRVCDLLVFVSHSKSTLTQRQLSYLQGTKQDRSGGDQPGIGVFSAARLGEVVHDPATPATFAIAPQ